ncbi:uncharacterized protein [Typha latifolia]|uniref:uncharacterized protein n=1 Tax=Typha latifolia TaxID=4733 RepID=UPI003C2AD288
MEFSAAISDPLSIGISATTHASAAVSSKLLLLRHHHSPSSSTTVRSNPCPPVIPRTLLRRSRRTRRISLTDGGDDAFSGDGDGDDGPFGGGGGGSGWGFGGGGGSGWYGSDPPPSPTPSSSDPAFDLVYEIMCWIALSNCTHFAFKKVAKLLAGRGKVVPLRLVPSMC